MINFFLGLDLGQVSDYTALAIVEKLGRHGDEAFHLRHLERLALGTSYPDVARHVKALLATEELAQKTQCVVDATGVGRPVVGAGSGVRSRDSPHDRAIMHLTNPRRENEPFS